jgi:hypothetical protein
LKKLFIDAKPGVMQDLETVHRLEGISGVSRLARKWKNSQPQGYLFWLNILKSVNSIIPPTNSTGHRKCQHAFADAFYPKLSDQQE